MTKYKTVEGHEIMVNEYYETREGEKAFAGYFLKDGQNMHKLVGHLFSRSGKSFICVWYANGRNNCLNQDGDEDLMRPWTKKKEKIT